MLYWGGEPPQMLELEFSTKGAGALMIGDQVAEFTGGACRIPLNAPPAPGETVDIKISPSRPTVFYSARWA